MVLKCFLVLSIQFGRAQAGAVVVAVVREAQGSHGNLLRTAAHAVKVMSFRLSKKKRLEPISTSSWLPNYASLPEPRFLRWFAFVSTDSFFDLHPKGIC